MGSFSLQVLWEVLGVEVGSRAGGKNVASLKRGHVTWLRVKQIAGTETWIGDAYLYLFPCLVIYFEPFAIVLVMVVGMKACIDCAYIRANRSVSV
jgi:hypothetical protein